MNGLRPECRLTYLALLILFLGLAVHSSAQDIATVRRSIENGDVEQKRDALYRIRLLGTEEASRLALPALQDPSEIVRATAASSVIFIPPDEASRSLLPLLRDKSAFVRREAAHALGLVGHVSAVAPLLKLMNDGDREVSASAAMALGEIGDVSAVEPLTKILANRRGSDNAFVRRSAARSIGQIAQLLRWGTREVVTPQNFLPDAYKLSARPPSGDAKILSVFETAAIALGKILGETSEAPDTRREAAFALGAIGSPSAARLLRSHASGPEPYLAEISREALLKIEKSPPPPKPQ